MPANSRWDLIRRLRVNFTSTYSPERHPVPIVNHKGKGKGKVHLRTGHEGPEGE